MRKVTNILLLWFPDQQASCCSHNYILSWILQRLCNLALTLNATLITRNRKQMLTCASTFLLSLMLHTLTPSKYRYWGGRGWRERKEWTAWKLLEQTGLGLAIWGNKTLVLIRCPLPMRRPKMIKMQTTEQSQWTDTQSAKSTAHDSQWKPWYMVQNQVTALKSHQKHDFTWKASGAVEGFPCMAFSLSLYSDCQQDST